MSYRLTSLHTSLSSAPLFSVTLKMVTGLQVENFHFHSNFFLFLKKKKKKEKAASCVSGIPPLHVPLTHDGLCRLRRHSLLERRSPTSRCAGQTRNHVNCWSRLAAWMNRRATASRNLEIPLFLDSCWRHLVVRYIKKKKTPSANPQAPTFHWIHQQHYNWPIIPVEVCSRSIKHNIDQK